MTKKIFLILLFSSLFLYSQTPKWIDNPRTVYSDEKYLSGVGKGESLENAKAKAFSDLASKFGTTVKSDVRSQERLSENMGKLSSSSSLEEDVKLASEHNLVNVIIADAYMDKKANSYYAIAVMDRQETSAILDSMIENNLKEVSSYLERAANENDLLKKFSFLDMAEIISRNTDIYLNQMMILDMTRASSKRIPTKLTSHSIRMETDNVAKSISFNISLSKELAELESSIKAVLTEMKMTVSTNPNAPYTIKDKLVTKGGEVYGMYTMDYTVTLNLVSKNGNQSTILNLSGKEIGDDKEDAIENAVAYLNRRIGKSLTTQFSKFLNEMISK